MSRKPGLYVHVPFCSAICPYCDFAVVTGDGARRARYLERLLRELEIPSELSDFDTLYLGGGTPSLLMEEELVAIRECAPVPADARVYLEANPEDVSDTAVRRWRSLGVTTLSLGIQSFDDEGLSFLGRRHSVAEAHRAIDTARRAGFETLSIDLMFGLPGQTVDEWCRLLDAAIAHEPDHLSCYQLTFHENTLFGRWKREGKLTEPGDERQADLFVATHRYLQDAGYLGYEVSNFARSPEHRSYHNEKYWDHTPYRGVGPSAHSFDGRTRWWNERSLFAWQKQIDSGKSPVAGRETLDLGELLLETLMLRLRTFDGLDFDAVAARFRVDLLEENDALVDRLCIEGLAELDGRRLRPTLDGLAVADHIASSFRLPDSRWQPTSR